MAQPEEISPQTPIEPGVIYLKEYFVERGLNDLEEIRLKKEFENQMYEKYNLDVYIKQIDYTPGKLQIYFLQRPQIEITTEPEPGPELDYNLIIKSGPGGIPASKTPAIVFYAVSIIAVILTSLIAFKMTEGSLYRIGRAISKPETGFFNLENIKGFLKTAGIITGAIILLLTLYKFVGSRKK